MGRTPCPLKIFEHGGFCYEIICVSSRDPKFEPKLYHLGKDNITMVDAIEVAVFNSRHMYYIQNPSDGYYECETINENMETYFAKHFFQFFGKTFLLDKCVLGMLFTKKHSFQLASYPRFYYQGVASTLCLDLTTPYP